MQLYIDHFTQNCGISLSGDTTILHKTIDIQYDVTLYQIMMLHCNHAITRQDSSMIMMVRPLQQVRMTMKKPATPTEVRSATEEAREE